MSFIEMFKLFVGAQFGFQSNKNTADTLLEFRDNAYDDFNDSNYMIVIFLDFWKAFDAVNHNIMLKKTGTFGFSWSNEHIVQDMSF